MATGPDTRATSSPGESRNAHFSDGAAKAGGYVAPHGFNVQAWINDGSVIDEARGRYKDDDEDLDFYDD